MGANMINLEKYKNSQQLVSIKRKRIDDEPVQGFLLGYSDKLVLLQYVYDFNLDGLVVIRRSDISKIRSSKTDIFHTQLLKDQGIFEKINFSCPYPLKSWRDILDGFCHKGEIIIVENEESDPLVFIIGKPIKLGKKRVAMKEFDSEGAWISSPVKIAYQDITILKVDINYIKVYKCYFEGNK